MNRNKQTPGRKADTDYEQKCVSMICHIFIDLLETCWCNFKGRYSVSLLLLHACALLPFCGKLFSVCVERVYPVLLQYLSYIYVCISIL